MRTKDNQRYNAGQTQQSDVAEFVSRQLQAARKRWGKLSGLTKTGLKELLASFSFSIAAGDLMLLDGRWYVTHTGLLRLARRAHCAGICVETVPELSDAHAGRWAFKATVYKTRTCRGFVGYGDADPTNVSPLVRGAEMRVAETRSVNRALRKAYGIGLCSIEEIGSTSARSERLREAPPRLAPKSANEGNGTSSTLRDRLTLLIRQHQLDPALVKLYAADFCGVHELRSASRELVEDFVNELARQAANDCDALLCKLNAYAPKRGAA